MKKFAVVLLLIVSMLTLSLSACARGGDDVNDGNDYDDEVVTIVVGIKADSTEKAYLSAFSKAFNRVDKSIKISVQTFADYQQAMNNYIATDSMPDIVWCTGDYHAPYSSTGHYEDLTPYFERDGIDLSKYYKTSIDSARLTIDPKAENYKSVWFMPRDYNRLTIMYNKDIFDKAKMEYPTNDWTWEDFLATCRTLREKMNNNKDGLSKFMYPADLLLSDNVGMFTALTNILAAQLVSVANAEMLRDYGYSVWAWTYNDVGALVSGMHAGFLGLTANNAGDLAPYIRSISAPQTLSAKEARNGYMVTATLFDGTQKQVKAKWVAISEKTGVFLVRHEDEDNFLTLSYYTQPVTVHGAGCKGEISGMMLSVSLVICIAAVTLIVGRKI